MKKIVLISCVSKKFQIKSKAKDLYISTYFKYNYKYAQQLNPDKIFILSAKYGLLDLEKEIEPYELTLNTMRNKEIEKWSLKVLEQLKIFTDLENDEFTFLSGRNYSKYLLPHLIYYKLPFQGLGGIGKQLQFLKKVTMR